MAKAALVVETAAPQHLQNKKKELITHCMSTTLKRKLLKTPVAVFLVFTMGPQLKSTQTKTL